MGIVKKKYIVLPPSLPFPSLPKPKGNKQETKTE